MPQAAFSAERKEEYPHLTLVHQIDSSGAVWATSGRNILVRKPDRDWRKVARFPFAPRDLFNIHRMGQRAARADKCNVYKNRHEQVLAIRSGTVYLWSEKDGFQELGKIEGDCVLHGSLAEDDAGNVLFGEYTLNEQRGPVRVWRFVAAENRIEVAYTFGPGEIRHIHQVARDPFAEDSYWIFSGDFQGECYFWKTDSSFQNVMRLGDGSQKWRAVRVFFTPTHLNWITDSHIDQNYAFRMDRATGELERGQEVDASAWYGIKTTDDLYVAFTTVEEGTGIHTEYSEVLVSDDAFHWESVYRYKKDAWRPMAVFKSGVIHCPIGEYAASDLLVSGEAMVGFDGTTHRLAISRSAPAGA